MAKRLFDLAGAGLALLLLAPLLLLLALAIRLDSAGPVFFRQERVGRLGVLFRIHKFRTMRVDAPALGLPLTVGRDARITRVGHWLRHYRLDELPQLMDVLLGRTRVFTEFDVLRVTIAQNLMPRWRRVS